MDNLLYGWTYEQWALATVGENPKSLQDAIEIKKEYMKKYLFSPIEKGIIIKPDGISRLRNYEAANKISNFVVTFLIG